MSDVHGCLMCTRSKCLETVGAHAMATPTSIGRSTGFSLCSYFFLMGSVLYSRRPPLMCCLGIAFKPAMAMAMAMMNHQHTMSRPAAC